MALKVASFLKIHGDPQVWIAQILGRLGLVPRIGSLKKTGKQI